MNFQFWKKRGDECDFPAKVGRPAAVAQAEISTQPAGGSPSVRSPATGGGTPPIPANLGAEAAPQRGRFGISETFQQALERAGARIRSLRRRSRGRRTVKTF